MKLILVNQRYGHSRTIVIKGWLKGLLSLCLLGAPVALGYMGYHLALANTANHIVSEKSAEGWEQQLDDQAQALAELKQNAEQQVEALTQRLATLQARLPRLDALGNQFEIDHGNDYLTRYAHAQDLLAEQGEIVNQGRAIALLASSGRRTGPHVHFEAYKNGRVVDPASYIRRTHR